MNTAIFKAYDVRGVYPDDVNTDDARAIGRAFAEFLGAAPTIAIGRDVRESGPALFAAFAEGVQAAGGSVVDIGMVTTEMLYFATAHYGYDGGVMVSASHNERQYNGFKFVRAGAQAVSMDTGLAAVRDRAQEISKSKAQNSNQIQSTKSENNGTPPLTGGGTNDDGTPPSAPSKRGGIHAQDVLNDYIDKLLTFIEVQNIKPFRIVANANFGMAGKVLEQLIARGGLPLAVVPMDFEPDGTFPKGKPDPLIEERRQETIARVREEGVDFGIAWDADADRIFFFDEQGAFVPGYYTISLLARFLLEKFGAAPILFDCRQVWASRATISEAGGTPIEMKPGHSFIKDRMRKEDALFAGENSGHFYFRDFYGVDSGMVPLLLMLQLLSEWKVPLSHVVQPLRDQYPISEEINTRVADTKQTIERIAAVYQDGKQERIDGLSVEYDDWRFNLRASNTEPVIRLNVEAKTRALVEEKVAALTRRIK